MANNTPYHWTLAQANQHLAAGDVSSRELTQACLERRKQLNDQLNFVVARDDDAALNAASASDERRKKGELLGPLDGIPVALKDMFLTTELPTTACSRILENYRSPYNATAWRKLKEQGAVLVGKLNQDEFAMGSSNETSCHGPCRNPWDSQRSCGGSSGGSAGAVAAGLCPGSLGTDTGGSVRQPAAFCGVVGLRPTYGRVSRRGVIAFASSLDQVGPLARDVTGCAMLLSAIAGHDPHDSTSLPHPAERYEQKLPDQAKGLTVGVAEELLEQADADVRATVRNAAAAMQARGATLRPVSLPDPDLAVAAYYVLACAEASSNLSRYDGVRYGPRKGQESGLDEMVRRTRGELFGAEVKRRILLGTYMLSAGYYDAYYVRAQKVRQHLARKLHQVLAEVDVILGPTTPTSAFALGAKPDPLSMYLSDLYTIPASLAGLPALSLNGGFCDSGLPVGVQLVGKALQEKTLLQAAYALERELGLSNLPSMNNMDDPA